MSTTDMKNDDSPRRRLARSERNRQLLDVAWRLIRDEGTDALTLGRLAEQSGVTKPVVYDHFGTRNGLLAALYLEFDERQIAMMETALAASDAKLPAIAAVIASSYVDCVLAQGREIPGVIAALASSPELETIRRESQSVFMQRCRDALAPFAGKLAFAPLCAMLGAAEALSCAAANGDITARQAQDELVVVIVAMVERNTRARSDRRARQ